MGPYRRVFIAIGSNLGNRLKNCQEAIRLVCDHDEISHVRSSSFYKTRPFDMDSENWFLNGVFEIRTSLSPEELIGHLMNVERLLGRDRAKGPDRIVDLDLLYMEGEFRDSEELMLPHPRFSNRDFVLMPWSEIAPDFYIKEFEKSVLALLKQLKGEPTIIEKMEKL